MTDALEISPDDKSNEGLNTPESWLCVDCGADTAPGLLSKAELEKALAAAQAKGEDGVAVQLDHRAEVYLVRAAVWKAAGMKEWDGCLCIGCLEKRLGRQLRPKDFQRNHIFNEGHMPATPRLRKRRGDR